MRGKGSRSVVILTSQHVDAEGASSARWHLSVNAAQWRLMKSTWLRIEKVSHTITSQLSLSVSLYPSVSLPLNLSLSVIPSLI